MEISLRSSTIYVRYQRWDEIHSNWENLEIHPPNPNPQRISTILMDGVEMILKLNSLECWTHHTIEKCWAKSECNAWRTNIQVDLFHLPSVVETPNVSQSHSLCIAQHFHSTSSTFFANVFFTLNDAVEPPKRKMKTKTTLKKGNCFKTYNIHDLVDISSLCCIPPTSIECFTAA